MNIAAAVLIAIASLASVGDSTPPPGDNAELRTEVEQLFTDYLATIDPVGSQFYASTCEYVEADVWACFAIDEGVVNVMIAPNAMTGGPTIRTATWFDPATGVPLPTP